MSLARGGGGTLGGSSARGDEGNGSPSMMLLYDDTKDNYVFIQE